MLPHHFENHNGAEAPTAHRGSRPGTTGGGLVLPHRFENHNGAEAPTAPRSPKHFVSFEFHGFVHEYFERLSHSVKFILSK